MLRSPASTSNICFSAPSAMPQHSLPVSHRGHLYDVIFFPQNIGAIAVRKEESAKVDREVAIANCTFSFHKHFIFCLVDDLVCRPSNRCLNAWFVAPDAWAYISKGTTRTWVSHSATDNCSPLLSWPFWLFSLFHSSCYPLWDISMCFTW